MLTDLEFGMERREPFVPKIFKFNLNKQAIAITLKISNCSLTKFIMFYRLDKVDKQNGFDPGRLNIICIIFSRNVPTGANVKDITFGKIFDNIHLITISYKIIEIHQFTYLQVYYNTPLLMFY